MISQCIIQENSQIEVLSCFIQLISKQFIMNGQSSQGQIFCHRKCFVWTYTYLDSVGAAMDQIKIGHKFTSFKSLCQYINTVRKFGQNLQYFPSYMLKQIHWLYVDKYHQELSSLRLCKHECLNTWIHTTLWTIVLIHHMKSIIHCVIKSKSV